MLDYSVFAVDGEREYYEDFVAHKIINNRACFIVNDGLGGHGKGDIASRLAAEEILGVFANSFKRNTFFEDAIKNAESRLEAEQERTGLHSAMKTTSVILLIEDDIAQWCHIGDTRLYHFRKGKIVSRTKDHSVPQMLVASGKLRESQIRFHEDRNRLLKVLGDSTREIQPEISSPVKIEKGMVFLLCTDGFWEWIDERHMQKMLKKSISIEDWIKTMGNYVVSEGMGNSMDNSTAMGVKVL